MNPYLKIVSSHLSNFNQSLKKTSLLIDKPWTLIDGDNQMQRLIFKKNGELILSKNGKVQIGRWEYIPEAKSLLLDRNIDKILCNEAFFDEGVMILKRDGTDHQFFILANENIIPDLDVLKYLHRLRRKKLNIKVVKLRNGGFLEMNELNSDFGGNVVGNEVSIDGNPVKDGYYPLSQDNLILEVENNKVVRAFQEITYTNSDNVVISITHSVNQTFIKNGDFVRIDGSEKGSFTISYSKLKNLVVRDNRVVRLEWKNKVLREMSKKLNTIIRNYNE